jgi:hypothetical protein
MKKVLWFSRHAMTLAQRTDLARALGEPLEITHVNGTAANVHVSFESASPEKGETEADFILTGTQPALKELVLQFNEVAVVLPIGMLQQLLPFAPAKRLLQAKNKRILLEDGKVQFEHDGWEAVIKVEIIAEKLK